MLVYASAKIVRDAIVKRTVAFTCQHVDEIVLQQIDFFNGVARTVPSDSVETGDESTSRSRRAAALAHILRHLAQFEFLDLAG